MAVGIGFSPPPQTGKAEENGRVNGSFYLEPQTLFSQTEVDLIIWFCKYLEYMRSICSHPSF